MAKRLTSKFKDVFIDGKIARDAILRPERYSSSLVNLAKVCMFGRRMGQAVIYPHLKKDWDEINKKAEEYRRRELKL